MRMVEDRRIEWSGQERVQILLLAAEAWLQYKSVRNLKLELLIQAELTRRDFDPFRKGGARATQRIQKTPRHIQQSSFLTL